MLLILTHSLCANSISIHCCHSLHIPHILRTVHHRSDLPEIGIHCWPAILWIEGVGREEGLAGRTALQLVRLLRQLVTRIFLVTLLQRCALRRLANVRLPYRMIEAKSGRGKVKGHSDGSRMSGSRSIIEAESGRGKVKGHSDVSPMSCSLSIDRGRIRKREGEGHSDGSPMSGSPCIDRGRIRKMEDEGSLGWLTNVRLP